MPTANRHLLIAFEGRSMLRPISASCSRTKRSKLPFVGAGL